jgi:hypothetical protein
VLGIVVGYLPVLVFLVIVPGFAEAFWESIRVLLEAKATNIPLPVPWPWLAPFGQLPLFRLLRGMMMGSLFILILIFGVVGMVWIIRNKLQQKTMQPILVAAILLSLPYAHYAFSRPDLEHLAPGIPPLLIGIFIWLLNRGVSTRWIGVVIFCGASVWSIFPAYPAWGCYSTQQCVEAEVMGDFLYIDRGTANVLASLNALVTRFKATDRTFISVPFSPGSYAALGKKSPMWEIYALFARNEDFQNAEITRIKLSNPSFAVVYDLPLDGREEMRFRNTHILINQYIHDNFEFLGEWSPGYQVFKHK